MIKLYLYGVSAIVLTGIFALIFRRNFRNSGWLVFIGSLCCTILCSYASFNHLQRASELYSLVGPIKNINLSFQIDPLSALFSIILMNISSLSALYGVAYMKDDYKRDLHWFLYSLLVAAMAMVLVANDAFSFTIFWELMTISSFFLVIHESTDKKVRQAGWIYLIASHFGLFCILSTFFLLSGTNSDLSFTSFQQEKRTAFVSGLIFILALCGFGAKAGFIPFQIWLPKAHPVAPSHVSALMSGGMIKLGLYGILRVFLILSEDNKLWWGYLVIILGIISGIVGIIYSIAQKDIKKFLAYSSIENIGIMLIGIGLGIAGLACENKYMSYFGFIGAFFHILNHLVFKSVLFFCAGLVIKATGIHNMNELGGLIKKIPFVGICFLIASAAICSLPFLNGFISEFLIFVASLYALRSFLTIGWEFLLITVSVVIALSLIGAFALTAFAKTFGIIFLGESRKIKLEEIKKIDSIMLIPLFLLSSCCFLLSLGSAFIESYFRGTITLFTKWDPVSPQQNLSELLLILSATGIIFYSFLFAFIFVYRSIFIRRREQIITGTWDCGYAAPDSRMQYTSTSFAQPTLEFFQPLLRTNYFDPKIEGIYPKHPNFKMFTSDFLEDTIFLRIINLLQRFANSLSLLERASIHFQILIIISTLIILLTLIVLYV